MAEKKRTNPVARAVAELGGLHAASMKTDIPYPSLCRYMQVGRIRFYVQARALAEASGVSIEELTGYSKSA